MNLAKTDLEKFWRWCCSVVSVGELSVQEVIFVPGRICEWQGWVIFINYIPRCSYHLLYLVGSLSNPVVV